MPLKTKARQRRMRVAVTLLSGLLPILLGFAILHMQAERVLRHSTEHTAEEALRQFELMLDNTAQAARELLPLAGQSCIDVNLALREQVTKRPFVRSTNLLWDDTIYCSSLFGDYHEKIASGDFANGQLLLMKGNPVTPDTALLVYRISDGKRGAMSTLD